MSWLLPLVMFKVPLVRKVSVPARRPPLQPMVPLKVALVMPESAPLFTVNEPLGLTVSGPFSASVWPLSESATVPGPLVPRMIAPTVVAALSETVTPALVMIAVSLAPGTLFGSQFAAVFQSPLVELVQLMVAALLLNPLVNSSTRRIKIRALCLGKWIFIKTFSSRAAIVPWLG